MKRALVLALVFVFVLVLSTLAFAGWHLAFEQDPLSRDAELTAGWDFGSERLGESNLFISGDFFVVQKNLWIYPNPWICGFDLGLNHEGVLYFDLGMDVQLEPLLLWPDYLGLNTWSTDLKLTGKINSAVTVWGKAAFVFDVEEIYGNEDIGIWTFTPTLGIEIRL